MKLFKSLIAAFALCISGAAIADTTINFANPSTWTLTRITSSTTVSVAKGFDSESACFNAALADSEKRKAVGSATYNCGYNDKAVTTYSVPRPPIPADVTKTVACPSGFTGSWTQTQTYTWNATTKAWVASAFTPTTAPAGACAVVVPPKPVDESQALACPSGTVAGNWNQTRTYTYNSTTNSWVAGAWTPTTAPSTSCATLAPKPADDTQVVACPTGTTGTWNQSRTYTYVATSNTWAAGAWTPSAAPAGACVPVVASNLPFINTAKIPAAQVGFSDARVGPPPGGLPVPNPSDVGAFRLGCTFSHMKFDDPIVFPGQPGASHLHMFVGNTGSNASSTSATIASSGNSTCSGGILNRSSYWAPAMIDTTDGTPIAPSGFLIYYKTGYGGVKPADVKAVPTGLRMISGNAKNTGEIAWGAVGRFSCVGGNVGVGWQQSIPTNCNNGNNMIMEVSFPQCWDGVNLDSPDHKSHMSDTTGSGCPATHPVALPEISYEIFFDLAKVNIANMKNWRLASDNYPTTTPGGYSAHGDYVMGWDPATMNKLIKNCDNTSYDCHTNFLGDGTYLY